MEVVMSGASSVVVDPGMWVLMEVCAFCGVLLAILLGDQAWSLMTFAPISSAVAGLIGALIGAAVSGRRRIAEVLDN
jgi:hypothetical protein